MVLPHIGLIHISCNDAKCYMSWGICNLTRFSSEKLRISFDPLLCGHDASLGDGFPLQSPHLSMRIEARKKL